MIQESDDSTLRKGHNDNSDNVSSELEQSGPGLSYNFLEN